MKDVPEGQRNSTIYSAACALRHYDFSFNAAMAAIIQTVSEWTTPVPEYEIRRTVESAYTHEPGKVSIYSVNGITAEYDENGKYIPKLPPVIPVASIINPPPLKSPIIAGYLREGEAMLISGSPKAGKSFLICQLALAVASGTDWVGQKCKKKKVLYIDAELQREVAQNRMHDIWRKCDTVIPVYPDNLDLISTKSDSVTLSDIADDIEHNAGKYDLVIIDPLYMFINSDQNDNTQMKKEMDQIKRIYATGASVIVNHHMTKGMQNGKMSIDRASGAGVISRFFDSILTLNLLQPEQEDDARPERIEADTRSFKQPEPINLWFDGFHTLDRSGVLISRPLLDPKKESNDKKVDDIVKRVNHCYLSMKEAGELTEGKFTVDEYIGAYAQCYGKMLARTTAREHLDKAGYSKESGEKMATRNGKPFKTIVTFYYPEGLEVPQNDN
jgi:archaellum biogenesis ATPase FlaH